MKVSKKILFITFFVICISTNLVFADTGKVNIEATRIRKEANTTSDIITVIYKNDEIEILEESGEWYKVKYKNDTGYVKKEFITASKEESKPQKTEESKTPTASETTPVPETSISQEAPVDESTLIISSETYAKFLPSFSSSNVVKFEASKSVKKITEINKWIKVTDGVNSGWILKTKTQSVAQVQAQAQAPTEPKNTVVENNNTTNKVENKIDNTISNNTVSNNTVTNTATSGNSVNKKATITVETAKVREKASTSSTVLGFLDYGDEIILLEQDGDWYKINFENKTGYIKNTLFKVSNETVSSRSLTEEREESKQEEQKIPEVIEKPEEKAHSNTSVVVDYAKQYLGYPYIVGGKNPTTGFDCSGFTRYVFLNFGYSLGATAASQTNIGTEISRNDLQSGDLILFLNEEKTGIGHTGIYLEGGEFIHAANPQRGVVTDNLNTNSYYNERFVSARRIVQ